MIKKMTKILVAFLLFSMVLTGCGNNISNAPSSSNTNHSENSIIENNQEKVDEEKITVHYATCLQKKENSEAVIGSYIVEIETVPELSENVMNYIEKEIKLSYPKTFSSYFSDGITSYEILDTENVTNSKGETIILKGKINEYNFYTFYENKLYDTDTPQTKTVNVAFAFELDEDTSYLDLMIEELKKK